MPRIQTSASITLRINNAMHYWSSTRFMTPRTAGDRPQISPIHGLHSFKRAAGDAACQVTAAVGKILSATSHAAQYIIISQLAVSNQWAGGRGGQ